MAFGSLVLELTNQRWPDHGREAAWGWAGPTGHSDSFRPALSAPSPGLDCTAKSALKVMTRGNRRWLVLQGDKLTQTREMGHGRDWSELESNASLERHSNLTCSEVLWTANRTQLWSRAALVSFFVTWAVASITVFGVGATQTTQGNMFTANPFLVRQDWEGE